MKKEIHGHTDSEWFYDSYNNMKNNVNKCNLYILWDFKLSLKFFQEIPNILN